MAQGIENTAKVKVDVATESKGDKLSLGALSEHRSIPAALAKPSENSAALKALPVVDFVITKGQNESVYTADGNVLSRQNNNKVDASCNNSVRSADGSEQRFGRSGLCKNIGDVKWGKSQDGVMDITVGGKVSLKLDNNWDLVSVSGSNSSVQFKNKGVSELNAGDAIINPSSKRDVRVIDLAKPEPSSQAWKAETKIYESRFDTSKVDLAKPELKSEPVSNQAHKPIKHAQTSVEHAAPKRIQAPLALPLDILPKR